MNTDTNQPENIVQRKTRRLGLYGPIYGGVWLVVIGIVFLLNNFGYFHGDAWGKLWPLFIIVPGFFMILGGFSRRDC